MYGKREPKDSKLDYTLVDGSFFSILLGYVDTEVPEEDSFRYLMMINEHKAVFSLKYLSGMIFSEKDFYEVLKTTVERMQESLQYHERDNWKLGLSSKQCIGSAVRHWVEYKLGNTDENHFGAFVFNIMCVWYYYARTEFEKDKFVRDLFSEDDYNKAVKEIIDEFIG